MSTSITVPLVDLERLVFEAVELSLDVQAWTGEESADGIIHALDLESPEDAAQVALPKRPFLAFREMPILPGGERDVRIYTYRWHIYDDRAFGYARIKDGINLVSKAYEDAALQLLTGGIIGSVVVGSASSATRDPSLNLLLRYVDVAVNAAS